MAIAMCLTLGLVCSLPLRQTQELMRSIAKFLDLKIPVPDFSTLSRRSLGLTLPAKSRTGKTDPVHLDVDCTGLKIFGEGEWLYEKHRNNARRKSSRKLHLGLDLTSGEIICADLTGDDVGDPSALLGLLDQVNAPVTRFLADGAYDGAPTSDLLEARLGNAAEAIIPPSRNAIPIQKSEHDPSHRDRHIARTHAGSRLAWQVSSGYNQRSRGETLMGLWKAVIGSKLKSRCFESQKTEGRIAVNAFNKMTELGRPTFVAVA